MTAPKPGEPTQRAESVARIRLAKASDEWLDALEEDFVTEERWEAIRLEYLDAHLAVCDLNDARLFAALERTDGI